MDDHCTQPDAAFLAPPVAVPGTPSADVLASRASRLRGEHAGKGFCGNGDDVSCHRPVTTREVGWSRSAEIGGCEWATITVGAGVFASRGVAIGTYPRPYRLEHDLQTGDRLTTTRLVVEVIGDGWRRNLDLRRAGADHWSIAAHAEGSINLPSPGGDPGRLDGALDCDLGLSPVTNSMPVLRHGLRHQGSVEFLMAWVSVPDLAVVPSRQRYTWLGERDGLTFVRYASGEFSSDLSFDDDGIVVDYPQLARRLRPASGPTGRAS